MNQKKIKRTLPLHLGFFLICGMMSFPSTTFFVMSSSHYVRRARYSSSMISSFVSSPTRSISNGKLYFTNGKYGARFSTSPCINTKNPLAAAPPSTTQQHAIVTSNNNNDSVLPLLDAFKLYQSSGKNTDDLILPYPKSLSPSSANEFKACPQSYMFQYLLNIKQPVNTALAKGSMCHEALEQIFDLEPEERSLETLQNYLRYSWAKVRMSDRYKTLFTLDDETNEGSSDDPTAVTATTSGRDIDAERKWGMEGLQLLENYFALEDPRKISPPNPIRREMWVKSFLSVNPKNGVTATATTEENTGTAAIAQPGNFLVRGIVDRIDLIHFPNGGSDEPKMGLRITDYKTGKVPDFKYSQAVNERIANENFWQLKIYALLIQEMMSNSISDIGLPDGFDLRMLRLLYLTSKDGEAKYLDMDLGETQQERDDELQSVHADLSKVWTDIHKLVDMQDPRVFQHCDRKFCFCHKMRPRFVKGTVWERTRP